MSQGEQEHRINEEQPSDIYQAGGQLNIADPELAQDTVVVNHTQHSAISHNPPCDGGYYARCGYTQVRIPEQSVIVRTERLYRESGQNWRSGDIPWQDIGWCDWLGQPTITFENIGGVRYQVITQGFKNWSHTRNREAEIKVFYSR